MSGPTEHPGLRIARLVYTNGDSLRAIGKRLGVSAQYLCEVFRGNRHLSAALAVRLEKTYRMDARQLLRQQASFDYERAIGDIERSVTSQNCHSNK